MCHFIIKLKIHILKQCISTHDLTFCCPALGSLVSGSVSHTWDVHSAHVNVTFTWLGLTAVRHWGITRLYFTCHTAEPVVLHVCTVICFPVWFVARGHNNICVSFHRKTHNEQILTIRCLSVCLSSRCWGRRKPATAPTLPRRPTSAGWWTPGSTGHAPPPSGALTRKHFGPFVPCVDCKEEAPPRLGRRSRRFLFSALALCQRVNALLLTDAPGPRFTSVFELTEGAKSLSCVKGTWMPIVATQCCYLALSHTMLL